MIMARTDQIANAYAEAAASRYGGPDLDDPTDHAPAWHPEPEDDIWQAASNPFHDRPFPDECPELDEADDFDPFDLEDAIDDADLMTEAEWERFTALGCRPY